MSILQPLVFDEFYAAANIVGNEVDPAPVDAAIVIDHVPVGCDSFADGAIG
jgi:hypothetical protein